MGPDLEEWSAALAAKLSGLDEVFVVLENARCGRSKLSADEEDRLGVRADGADIPHQYARVLTRLIDALGELSVFADGRGTVALHALRFDLLALDEGNKAQRLTPASRDGRPSTPTGKRVYQAQVILCVRLLEEIGLSISAARKETANIFGEHGHRGQAGEKLSPETLTRWREMVLGPDGAWSPGRRMIERKLATWRADPAWPPSLEEVRTYVAIRAARPVISLAASK